MSAGRLILWRHGRTAYNADARLQGQIDIPLDDVGHWQAATAAPALLRRRTPARIISSDLVRARETAGYLGALSGVEVELDPRLRERSFGLWEGLTGEEIQAGWPVEFAHWRNHTDPAGVEAEPRRAVAERVLEAVAEHTATLERHDTLVLVAHGAAISTAVNALIGMDAEWRGITGMTNAHWAELVATGPQVEPAWRLTGYNLGPLDASSDWDAGPDRPTSEADTETRDPD
ncbi:histidine phosphatase family protein [Cellulomonas soli]